MKLILFDIDGTLCDSTSIDDKCFIEAFHEYFELDISDQNWEDIKHVTDWGITEEIVKREFGTVPDSEDYNLLKEIFVRKLLFAKETEIQHFRQVKGATAFFNDLRSNKDVGIGIATGSWRASALVKLGAIGIDPKGLPFSNCDLHKSREAITNDTIQQANEQNPHQFEEIIYFGDGKWDYLTCQKLGLRFIGIDVKRNNKLKKLGAETVYENFLDKVQIRKAIGIAQRPL